MPTRRIPSSLVLLLVLLVQAGAILPAANLCLMPGGCDRAAAAPAGADCHGDVTLAGTGTDCCGDDCMIAPSTPLLSRISAPEAAGSQASFIVNRPLDTLIVSALTPAGTLAGTARGRPPIHLVLHSLLI